MLSACQRGRLGVNGGVRRNDRRQILGPGRRGSAAKWRCPPGAPSCKGRIHSPPSRRSRTRRPGPSDPEARPTRAVRAQRRLVAQGPHRRRNGGGRHDWAMMRGRVFEKVGVQRPPPSFGQVRARVPRPDPGLRFRSALLGRRASRSSAHPWESARAHGATEHYRFVRRQARGSAAGRTSRRCSSGRRHAGTTPTASPSTGPCRRPCDELLRHRRLTTATRPGATSISTSGTATSRARNSGGHLLRTTHWSGDLDGTSPTPSASGSPSGGPIPRSLRATSRRPGRAGGPPLKQSRSGAAR